MKKILLFLGCLELISTHAFAEDILLIRKAEAYFEAKEFDKARSLYEKLEGESLHSWQKGRLLYNIGTVDMEEGKWDEAQKVFADSASLPDKGGVHMRALDTNLAVLFYREGLEALKKDRPSPGDYTKALFLFRNALQKIEEAQQAECRYSGFIGEKSCEKGEDLLELHKAVKIEQAMILKKYNESRIAEMPLNEGIPLLLSGIKSTISNLDFLISKGLDEKLKENYIHLFTGEAQSWVSLWDALEGRSEDLKKARNDYLEGINTMEKSKLEESKTAFHSSQTSLSELMQKIWGKDPLLKSLQSLLAGYDRALEQFPLQNSSLNLIKTEQKQAAIQLKNENISSPLFNNADKYLAKSLKFANKAQLSSAQFFLNEARQQLRRLLRTKTAENETPTRSLEEAIQDQTHALTLQRLSQTMKNNIKEEKAILTDSQQQTLKTAELFIPAVRKKEEEDYPAYCQCKPWDEALPLFENGRHSAFLSDELIKKGHHPASIMKQQEKTIKFWQEALKKLKTPPQKSPPSQLAAGLPPLPQEKNSLNDILRVIQEMNQQDNPPPETTKTETQVLRPW